MLCFSSVIAFTYDPESSEWIRTTYMSIEPIAVALRFLACVECVWKKEAIKEWSFLANGLMGVAFISLTTIWALEPGSSVFTFVQLRRYAQIGTSVFMIGFVLVLWVSRLWLWDSLHAHILILFVLTVKQAVYSLLSMRGVWQTSPQWYAADWPGLLITSLCCLAWTCVALQSRPQPSQSLTSARHGP